MYGCSEVHLNKISGAMFSKRLGYGEAKANGEGGAYHVTCSSMTLGLDANTKSTTRSAQAETSEQPTCNRAGCDIDLELKTVAGGIAVHGALNSMKRKRQDHGDATGACKQRLTEGFRKVVILLLD